MPRRPTSKPRPPAAAGEPVAPARLLLAYAAVFGVVILITLFLLVAGRWVIMSWMGAGAHIPRHLRFVAYLGGLAVALGTAFGVPRIRRLAEAAVRPAWVGEAAGVAAYLLAIVTAVGASIFAVMNAVPGGDWRTAGMVVVALVVMAVSFIRACKG